MIIKFKFSYHSHLTKIDIWQDTKWTILKGCKTTDIGHSPKSSVILHKAKLSIYLGK